jgi:hypothetical protein
VLFCHSPQNGFLYSPLCFFPFDAHNSYVS